MSTLSQLKFDWMVILLLPLNINIKFYTLLILKCVKLFSMCILEFNSSKIFAFCLLTFQYYLCY